MPGVIYGGGDTQNFAFKVDGLALRKLLADGAALLDVVIDEGRTRPVIVKDQQNHPVRGDVMHIDFLEVRLDEAIQTTVSVELEGGEESPGVKEGGVLEHVTRELNVEALPTDIPDQIVVDVSNMEIAATLSLSEVPAPNGVTFLDDADETVIATLVVPTEVEEPEIEAGDRADRRGRRADRRGRGRGGRRGRRGRGCRGRGRLRGRLGLLSHSAERRPSIGRPSTAR